jgi:hypothetical protein
MNLDVYIHSQGFCLKTNFQLIWVNTEKYNCGSHSKTVISGIRNSKLSPKVVVPLRTTTSWVLIATIQCVSVWDFGYCSVYLMAFHYCFNLQVPNEMR